MKVGDSIHAPAVKAGMSESYSSAMVSGKICEIDGKKLKMSLPNGEISKPIYINLVRRKLSLFIVQIGDYQTEETLLVPLKKSIFNYSRLILPDDYIRCISVRTTKEFQYFWKKNNALISHLILIAHGKNDSILFGENNWVNPKEFLSLFEIAGKMGEAKQIISLCCKTGGAKFGKIVSESELCEIFIGPSGTVHGASASQFYQTYLAYQFIHGYTSKRAYDYARVSTPGLTEFNLWDQAILTKKKSKREIFLQ